MPDVLPNGRLATVLGEAGLSRKTLARAVRELSMRRGRPVKCNHTTVGRWLAGGQPRAQTAQLIADVLGGSTGRFRVPCGHWHGRPRQWCGDGSLG